MLNKSQRKFKGFSPNPYNIKPIWINRIGDGTNTNASTSNFFEDKYNLSATDSENSIYVIMKYTGSGDIYNYTKETPNHLVTSGVTLTNVGIDNGSILIKYNQHGKFIWKIRINSNTFEPSNITVDSEDNIIIVGKYSDTVNIYNIDGTLATTKEIDAGNNILMSKFSKTGTHYWSIIIGNGNVITTIYTDSNNNIYIGIMYISTLNIRDTSDILISVIQQINGYTHVIVSYDKNGTYNTNIRIVSDYKGYIGGIKKSSTGDIYITGQVSNTMLFYDASDNLMATISGYSGYWTFISKFTDFTTHVWTSAINGTGGGEGKDIIIDSSDNVYIVGNSISATLRFYNTSNASIITIATGDLSGNSKGFLCKYNTSGIPQWATMMRGSSNIYMTRITKKSTSLVIGGYRYGSMDIYNASDNTLPVTTVNYYADTHIGYTDTDSHVIEYDLNGNYKWVIVNQPYSFICGLSVDSFDGIVEIICNSNTPDLELYDSKQLLSLSTNNEGGNNTIFIVKYADGTYNVPESGDVDGYILNSIRQAYHGATMSYNGSVLDIGTTGTYNFNVYDLPANTELNHYDLRMTFTIASDSVLTNYKFIVGLIDTVNIGITDGLGDVFKISFYLKVYDKLTDSLVTDFSNLPLGGLNLKLSVPSASPATQLVIYKFDTVNTELIKTLITTAVYNSMTNTYDFILVTNSTYGGGGEPHIRPIIRRHNQRKWYDLPDIDGSCWRLIEYDDLIVNCSTKKLKFTDFPEYVHILNKKDKVHRDEVLHLENLTYFDELYIKYKDNELVIDVDSHNYFSNFDEISESITIHQDIKAYKGNLSLPSSLKYTKTDTSKYMRIKINMDNNEYINIEVYSDLTCDDRSNVRIGDTNIDLFSIRGCFYAEDDLVILDGLDDVIKTDMLLSNHKKIRRIKSKFITDEILKKLKNIKKKQKLNDHISSNMLRQLKDLDNIVHEPINKKQRQPRSNINITSDTLRQLREIEDCDSYESTYKRIKLPKSVENITYEMIKELRDENKYIINIEPEKKKQKFPKIVDAISADMLKKYKEERETITQVIKPTEIKRKLKVARSNIILSSKKLKDLKDDRKKDLEVCHSTFHVKRKNRPYKTEQVSCELLKTNKEDRDINILANQSKMTIQIKKNDFIIESGKGVKNISSENIDDKILNLQYMIGDNISDIDKQIFELEKKIKSFK
jgi:hypothetical protein